MGANVSTTYISCPVSPSKTLGIKLPFFGDDHKEREEVLYIRGSGEGRQGSEETVPCLQLPVDDEGEAIYLYDADATG